MKLHNPVRPVAKRISLIPNDKRAGQINSQIAISFSDHIRLIDVSSIIYLKAESNYTHIYLDDNEHLIASITLKSFEHNFDARAFLRVHQSYIIQAKFLKEFQNKCGCIVLRNNSKIPVSRSKKQLVINYLKSFMI